MDVDGMDAVDVVVTNVVVVVVGAFDIGVELCVSVVGAVDVCNGTFADDVDGTNARGIDDMLFGITRSTPGTIAAGMGGVAGSGDIGSLVGRSGGRNSGNLL